MSTLTETTTDTEIGLDEPWAVVLWDDPVNEMRYVAHALRQVFGFSAERAEEVMLEAHTNGRARAWSGERHDGEARIAMLHQWKLNATLERA